MLLAEASTFSFRAILDAMSNPGRLMPVPEMPTALPSIPVGAGAALLTLLDGDTPVYLDEVVKTDDLVERIRFQTGAPMGALAKSSFAVVPAEKIAQASEHLSIGTPEYPDNSATLIVAVSGFDGELTATLSGPGIQSTATLAPEGVSAEGWQALMRNAELYPLGFDTIFAGPDFLAALPRSTRIQLEER